MQPSAARLVRHPDSRDSVRGIAVRLERTGGALRVRYELDADLGGLRIPAAGPMRQGERLWQHTCFEIFLSARMPAYQEFNFSPSREWASYSFSRYRESAGSSSSVKTLQVEDGTKLILEAAIALDSGPMKAAVSAVIESSGGSLSYWALRHPPGKPDFHHPDGFALELDEVRN